MRRKELQRSGAGLQERLCRQSTACFRGVPAVHASIPAVRRPRGLHLRLRWPNHTRQNHPAGLRRKWTRWSARSEAWFCDVDNDAGPTAGACDSSNETLLLLDDTQNIPGNAYQRAEILRQAIYDLQWPPERSPYPKPPSARVALVSRPRQMCVLHRHLTQGHVPIDASMGVRYIDCRPTIFLSVPKARWVSPIRQGSRG